MTAAPRFPLVRKRVLALAALATLAAANVHAQIKVGVSISTTGPAASLGIPEKNTVSLFPAEIAGQKVQYIVLDDASDATQAVKNARKLVHIGGSVRLDLRLGKHRAGSGTS